MKGGGHPWLSPVAPVDAESGWTDPGATLAWAVPLGQPASTS